MSAAARVVAAAVLCAIVAALITVWLSDRQPRTPSSSDRPATVEPAPEPATAARHPRVVALGPALSQILRQMHCAHLQVGRHASDAWCDQSLAVCGDQSGIDYEALIAVEPTHVLLQWGDRPLPDRLLLLAKERGWSVVNIPLLALNDVSGAVIAVYDHVVAAELRALDAEHGLRTWNAAGPRPHAPPTAEPDKQRAQLSRAAFNILTTFDQALSTDQRLADAGPTLLLYQSSTDNATGRASLAALGPGSYHHDILLRIGGTSAIRRGSPFMPLDAEDIIALAPEVIILIRPRNAGQPPSPDLTPQQIVSSAGLQRAATVPAIVNQRVALIDDPMSLIPGTNLLQVAQSIRASLAGFTPAHPADRAAPAPPPAPAEPRP